MKRILALALALALLLSGCGGQKRYQYQFFDTFDTVVTLTLYAGSERQADEWYTLAHERFLELHRLYDAFNEYEGLNNIATLNRLAHSRPVEVPRELYALLELCAELYGGLDGQLNIALGGVTGAWREAIRTEGAQGEPDADTLAALAQGVDPAAIVLTAAQDGGYSVYDPNPANLLDVGAVAKGYAAGLAADTLRAAGCASFLISAGGNVVAGDAPADGSRDYWNVGIQSPFSGESPDAESVLAVARLTGLCMVTSGDYQRYYIDAAGNRIHHIIDPDILRPAAGFRGVTIICESSGLADALSTALFCMDYERGRAVAERFGVGALWVLPDGSYTANEAALALLAEQN